MTPRRSPVAGARRRGRAGSAVVAALLLLLAVAPAAPAAAQRGELGVREDRRVELGVEQLTGVVVPDGEFSVTVVVRNTGDADLRGVRVLGTVHRRRRSRPDFQAAMQGRLGDVWTTFDGELSDLRVGQTRRLTLSRPAARLGFSRPEDKLGVYPLRLQVLVRGVPRAEAITSLVLVPAEVAEPLHVAVLAPLDAPPGRRADGTYDGMALSDAMAAGGRLATVTGALLAHPDVPVTLAASGLLLEQAADQADGFTVPGDGRARDLRAGSIAAGRARRFLGEVQALADRSGLEQVAVPYGPSDLVALVRSGMAQEAIRTVNEGAATTALHADADVEADVLWPPDGLDAQSLEALRATGVEAVVLSEGHLALDDDRAQPFSPSPVRRLGSPGGARATALVPDPWLEDLLAEEGTTDPALVAQRILAETAAVYFERPFAADPRGLLLAPPQLWDVDAATLGALLDGLGDAPWLRPVGLRALADRVAPEEEPVRLGYPAEARARERSPEAMAELREARRALGSLAEVLVEAEDEVALADRLLLQATSVHYRYPPLRAEGRALAASVLARAEAVAGGVEVVDGPMVTLTAAEGRLPVTVRNTTDEPLRVQVRLQENPRYRFTEQASEQVVLEPATPTTLLFRAEAVTFGGTYGVPVVVEDPSGSVVLTRGTVVVRAGAYSLVALALTGGAGGFLVLWWLRDVLRRRRERHAGAQAEAPAQGAAGAA